MGRLRQSAVLPGGTGRGFRVSLGSERLKEGLGALLHLSVWLALLLRGTLLLEKRGAGQPRGQASARFPGPVH